MSDTATPSAASPEIGLAWWEIRPEFVEPAIRAFRMVNTWADTLFYNVGELETELAALDLEVATMKLRDGRPQKSPSRILDLDAMTNPKGALLLIDATTAPYVHRYDNVEAFLDSPYEQTRQVDCVTITGVGSSAYGSAALGWQVSRALGRPVLAIVPGYGLADMVQQALGGWFGFGMHEWLRSKAVIQHGLAVAAPAAASVGRNLTASTPGAASVNAAPIFRHGSGSSDALHALLSKRPGQVRMVIGHSKGALVIGNALRDLPPAATNALAVITLGCAIGETPCGSTRQVMGALDGLGMLNSWGNRPTDWELAWHTTNLRLWLPMQADRIPAEIVKAALALVAAGDGAENGAT